jgi:heme/copper-type cytochrome/quinol oxidase subunit 3
VNDLLIESFLYFNLSELSVLYLGFKLFILSEFMIFLSLFGSFLNHTLLSLTFSSLFVVYFAIPFSNLLILLYSSFSIQSSLIFMKFGFLLNTVEGLSQTIGIGILFVVLQFKEFLFSIYSYSSSFLGSILYFTTGLHGIHVIIGLLLLLFSFYAFFLFVAISHQPS